MTKPEILNEKPISMAELKEELEKIKERDKKLGESAKRTEEYINQFLKLDVKKALELKEKLEKLSIPRLKEQHIAKIIEILPKNIEDIKAIFQGYTLTVSNENMKKIVDTVESFVKKEDKK